MNDPKKEGADRTQLVTGAIFLILLATTIVTIIVGDLPKDKFYLALGAIIIASIIVFIIGLVALRATSNLTYRAERVLQGFLEMHKLQDGFASNEELLKDESEADRVRIISPDIDDDLNEFYPTIKKNLAKGKIQYQYVIPEGGPMYDMNRMLDKLAHELETTRGELRVELIPLPIKDSPIITKYVLYEGAKGDKRASGFMEIPVGSGSSKTVNVRLDKYHTRDLLKWVDELSEKYNK